MLVQHHACKVRLAIHLPVQNTCCCFSPFAFGPLPSALCLRPFAFGLWPFAFGPLPSALSLVTSRGGQRRMPLIELLNFTNRHQFMLTYRALHDNIMSLICHEYSPPRPSHQQYACHDTVALHSSMFAVSVQAKQPCCGTSLSCWRTPFISC